MNIILLTIHRYFSLKNLKLLLFFNLLDNLLKQLTFFIKSISYELICRILL